MSKFVVDTESLKAVQQALLGLALEPDDGKRRRRSRSLRFSRGSENDPAAK